MEEVGSKDFFYSATASARALVRAPGRQRATGRSPATPMGGDRRRTTTALGTFNGDMMHPRSSSERQKSLPRLVHQQPPPPRPPPGHRTRWYRVVARRSSQQPPPPPAGAPLARSAPRRCRSHQGELSETRVTTIVVVVDLAEEGGARRP